MELLGKSREELRGYCRELGEPAYRGDQIYHWLYAEREFSIERMSNLPAALREKLQREATITMPTVRQTYVSADGSVRYLLGLGERRTRKRLTLRRRGHGGHREEKRVSNVGGGGGGVHAERRAADDLHFDAGGMRGGLPVLFDGAVGIDPEFDGGGDCGAGAVAVEAEAAGERSGIAASQEFRLETESRTPTRRSASTQRKRLGGLAARTNVVLMGQGEPLLNFENVMGALRILLDPEGVGLSPKHVTLSTSGIVPGIERMGKEEVRPKLAISLNASCDEQRDVLMPINKKWPLKPLDGGLPELSAAELGASDV